MNDTVPVRKPVLAGCFGLLIYTALYAAAFGLDRAGTGFVPALLLIGLAVYLYCFYYRRSGTFLDPAALLSLFFTGGQGISLLRLSYLQKPWEPETWLCFWIAHICFVGAYLAAAGALRRKEKTSEIQRGMASGEPHGMASGGPHGMASGGPLVFAPGQCFLNAKGLTAAIVTVTVISVVSFLIEASVLEYIPLFTVDTPHAYSYFHVSGLHYFTVSCVLVPSLFVLLLFSRGIAAGKRLSGMLILSAVCTAAAFLLPLLLVSRFQMIFSAALAGLTVLLLQEDRLKQKLSPKVLIIAGSLIVLVLALYVFLTVERAHSVSYLNGIFEMRVGTPIWITQPYIYIANNYDNFNCLVRDLPEHTRGLRMLYPVFALTGLKFLKPELAAFPLYVTKEELTTVTLYYDAYYDFGAAGIAVCSVLLGIVMAVMVQILRMIRSGRIHKFSPVIYLIMAQLDFYLVFSFFTTWYSNPATWFYLGFSLLIYIFTVSEYGTVTKPTASEEVIQ